MSFAPDEMVSLPRHSLSQQEHVIFILAHISSISHQITLPISIRPVLAHPGAEKSARALMEE
jgi:hypothetical protein